MQKEGREEEEAAPKKRMVYKEKNRNIDIDRKVEEDTLKERQKGKR